MHDDYQRIARVIDYLACNIQQQPSLGELAAVAGVRPDHLQRLFGRWTGVSPKRLLQALTADYADRLLVGSKSTLDVGFASGLSGPGHLHGLTVTVHAATPGGSNRGGEELLHYGYRPTPLGEALIATGERGICALHFVGADRAAALAAVRSDWPKASLVEDDSMVAPVAERLWIPYPETPLPLRVCGTPLQVRVWEALLRIPAGDTWSYQRLAAAAGYPHAARAVANAIARNTIAYLIPCHRVIRKSAHLGGYRWGAGRKRLLLAWEGMHEKERRPLSGRPVPPTNT